MGKAFGSIPGWKKMRSLDKIVGPPMYGTLFPTTKEMEVTPSVAEWVNKVHTPPPHTKRNII